MCVQRILSSRKIILNVIKNLVQCHYYYYYCPFPFIARKGTQEGDTGLYNMLVLSLHKCYEQNIIKRRGYFFSFVGESRRTFTVHKMKFYWKMK